MFSRANQIKIVALALSAVTLAACGGQATPVPTALPTATVAAVEATPVVDAPTQTPTDTVEPVATVEEVPTTAPTTVAAATKISLNTATADEILTVPGVGNRMVREFMEYRPYTTIAQFRREIGKYVDAAQVADYEKYVFVPVSPNNADADTLQQLPGVTQSVADALIAARPYATKDAFLAKLGELVSAEQAAAASSMVEAQ